MRTGKQKQLTKQTGEYLVCAELCRRGYIASSFTGNVPEFDVIAINDYRAIKIQVKTTKGNIWQLNAKNYFDIEINQKGKQSVKKKDLSNNDIIYVFVKLDESDKDNFFIIKIIELQKILYEGYTSYLSKHDWKRPKNPNSTHITINKEQLSRCRDDWTILFDNK